MIFLLPSVTQTGAQHSQQQDTEVPAATVAEAIQESGHLIQKMLYRVSASGQIRLRQKACHHCSIQETPYECKVCLVTVCQSCIPTHLSEAPGSKKVAHRIRQMDFVMLSSGKRKRRRRDCWHCSCKNGKKRRLTPFECIDCQVGVCVDCQEVHGAPSQLDFKIK